MIAFAGQYQRTIYPASPARSPQPLHPSLSVALRAAASRARPAAAISAEPAVDEAEAPTRVAFVTTPKFRAEHAAVVEDFVRRELYRLSQRFNIVCSGTTFAIVRQVLARDFSDMTAEEKRQIGQGMQRADLQPGDYAAWRAQVAARLSGKLPGVQGVVEILFDLVEGRLAGVIHLAHPSDLESKADSRVLWRAANVHDVPIAHDVNTAARFIAAWQRTPAAAAHRRPETTSPLADLAGDNNVIAIISHDGKKSEMCAFAEKNAERIAAYDYVLATATTGAKLTEVLLARDPAWPVYKIRCCLSGPQGGDIQIACAVLRGLCQKVVFFQDPWTSHAHEADIRLFEKVLLECPHPVELATNRAAAEIIL